MLFDLIYAVWETAADWLERLPEMATVEGF